MNEKNAKNTIDSAHPRPRQAGRLSEKEKKAMELSGTIEHTDGARRVDLQRQVRDLEKEK